MEKHQSNGNGAALDHMTRFRGRGSSRSDSTPPRSVASGRDAGSWEFDQYAAEWIGAGNGKITVSGMAGILAGADEGCPRDQAALFQAMLEKEPVIAAHMQTRIMAALACDWRVTPRDPSPESARRASEVAAMLRDAGIHGLLRHLLSAIGAGYAGSAILWAEGGGSVKAFKHVVPSNWLFDKVGNPALAGLDGSAKPLADFHPAQFVFHTHSLKPGLPCQGGLLRALCWLYFFKHYAVRDRARYLERFGVPFMMAKISRDDFDSDDVKSQILRSLVKMGNDGVGVVTKDTSLDVIHSPPNSCSDFQSWCEYIDDIFALLLLGQTASSKAASGFSKGQIQENVRRDILEADCRGLAETINKQLIAPLERFKYGTEKTLEFSMDYMLKENLKEKAEIVKLLAEAGFKIQKAHIEKIFGMPVEGAPEANRE